MKRMIMEGPGKIVWKEAEMPVRKPGEALLKILYGGICGSDLSSYRGTMKYITYPRTPGHEFSAQIVEIDENNAKGLKTGDIVTAIPYFNCGHCYSCRKGLPNCCASNQTMGIHREGAFMEYITLDDERLFDGKGLDPKTLALVEPFCISYHGVKRLNLHGGERVLVIGAGTIGVLAAIAAMARGAEVTLCDVSQQKLDYAKRFGVQHTLLNSSPEAFSVGVKEMTGGDGFDVTVEAVGLPSTFLNCMEAVSFGGKMLQIGVGKQNADFFFTTIQQKELTVIGSRNARRDDFEEAINLLAEGRFCIEDVVTNLYPLDRAADAFEDFHQNAGSMLKVMIDFR